MALDTQASSTERFDADVSQQLSEFNALGTDDKLGLLWVLYENMGKSITPAAPGAAEPQFTQRLLDEVIAMEEGDQLAFMRDLVEQKQTEETKTYGAFSENNKLLFWYQLSEGMTAGDIIPVPESYELPAGAAKLFSEMSSLEFNQQITLLRQTVLEMGAS